MTTISLCMIVRNEELKISRCLESVKDFVDEIVIVDTGSTDRTLEIAKKYTDNVHQVLWEDDFSKARNQSVSFSHGDYILVMDADEMVSNRTGKFIRAFVENNSKKLGKIKIVNSFNINDEIQESTSFITRIFPRNCYFEGKIHEQIVSDLNKINTKIEIYHDGYLELDKGERNLLLLLNEIKHKPNDVYLLYQIGKEYKIKNEIEMALSYFEKSYENVKSTNTKSALVFIEYFKMLHKLKQFKKADALLLSEEKLYVDFPDLFFNKGLFYLDYLIQFPEKSATKFHLIEESFLKCLKLGETNKYESVKGTGSFLASYNLGLFYELMGKQKRAKYYYQLSASSGYKPAILKV